MIPSRSALILSALLALLPPSAQAWEEATLPVATLTSGQALVVDSRAPEEWVETGILPGVERLTFTDPESFAKEFLAVFGDQIEQGRDVVLVCRSGRRSAAAAEALSTRVANRVVSQAGGMNDLLAQGAEVQQP